jgi:hypothetical protein
MAPEQLHGEATPATDVFGLGATLAALATGTEADKLPRNGLKVDLGQVMAPSQLRDLLEQMLEPDPKQRLASVDAVRAALGSDRNMVHTEPQEQEGEPSDGSPGDVEGPLNILLRIIGTAGYVVLTVVDVVLVPLIFVMAAAAGAGKRGRKGLLEQRRKTVHKTLRSGREAMRAVSQGKSPYQLKGGERGQPPALPPERRRHRRPRLPRRGRRRR